MLHIPVLRWGEPYESLEIDKVVHFATGEALAEVSQANGGLLERDMRHAQRARDVLREIPITDLLETVKKAGRPVRQRPSCRSATARRRPTSSPACSRPRTGLPEHMCKFNMEKNHFVLDATWTRSSTR